MKGKGDGEGKKGEGGRGKGGKEGEGKEGRGSLRHGFSGMDAPEPTNQQSRVIAIHRGGSNMYSINRVLNYNCRQNDIIHRPWHSDRNIARELVASSVQ